MGCGCVRENKVKMTKTEETKQLSFTFSFVIESAEGKLLLEGELESESKSMLFVDLINKVCFASKYSNELEACFTAEVNKNDEVEYKIERLLGKSEKAWELIINDRKENWQNLCERNPLIGFGDGFKLVLLN